MRSVFEAPTIAGLALEVEKAQAMGLKARSPILQRRPRNQAASREALLAQLDTSVFLGIAEFASACT